MKLMNQQAGLTLIEVIVVMSLLAILMAMATPSLMWMRENAEFRDAARGVANQMQEVRSLAIRDGIAHRIDCDPEAGSCELGKVEYNTTNDEWESTLLSSYVFPSRATMRTGTACDKLLAADSLEIEFFPNGNAEIRGAMTEPRVCINEDSSTTRYMVTLTSLTTGRVVIDKP